MSDTIRLEGASKELQVKDLKDYMSHTTWLGRTCCAISLLFEGKGWLNKEALLSYTDAKKAHEFVQIALNNSTTLDKSVRSEFTNIKNLLIDEKTEKTAKGKLHYLK
jgi:hypothetical protein